VGCGARVCGPITSPAHSRHAVTGARGHTEHKDLPLCPLMFKGPPAAVAAVRAALAIPSLQRACSPGPALALGCSPLHPQPGRRLVGRRLVGRRLVGRRSGWARADQRRRVHASIHPAPVSPPSIGRLRWFEVRPPPPEDHCDAHLAQLIRDVSQPGRLGEVSTHLPHPARQHTLPRPAR